MKKYNIDMPLKSVLMSETPYGMTPQNKILYSAKINFSLNHQEMNTPLEDDTDGIEGLQRLKDM